MAEKGDKEVSVTQANNVQKTNDQEEKWYSCLVPNMSLLPLKLVIFFYSSSAFSLLPYLTIHMKVKIDLKPRPF